MDAREALQQVMRAHGIKQGYVAKQAGLTERKLSDVFCGRRKLDANELFAICKAMRITPDEVFRTAEEQT